MTKSNYQSCGSYTDQILGVRKDVTKGGKECIIIEKEVLKAKGGDKHKVGDRVLHYLMQSTPSYGADLNDVMAKSFAVPTSAVTEEIINYAVSDDQPLVGVRLTCEVTEIETKAGKTWKQVTYGPRLTNGAQPSATRPVRVATQKSTDASPRSTAADSPWFARAVMGFLDPILDEIARRVALRSNSNRP